MLCKMNRKVPERACRRKLQGHDSGVKGSRNGRSHTGGSRGGRVRGGLGADASRRGPAEPSGESRALSPRPAPVRRRARADRTASADRGAGPDDPPENPDTGLHARMPGHGDYVTRSRACRSKDPKGHESCVSPSTTHGVSSTATTTTSRCAGWCATAPRRIDAPARPAWTRTRTRTRTRRCSPSSTTGKWTSTRARGAPHRRRARRGGTRRAREGKTSMCRGSSPPRWRDRAGVGLAYERRLARKINL